MRALGAFETAQTLTDLFSPLNIVVVVRLRRGPQPSRLRKALDAVQARYAALTARVVRRKTAFLFETGGSDPVPLAVEDLIAEDQWRGRVEAELGSRIDIEKGPLLRCRYLYSPDGPSDLLLTFHHALIDARSLEGILREILSSFHDGPPVGPPHHSEALLPPPQEALFPRGYQAPLLWVRQTLFVAKMIRAELAYRRAARHQRAPAVADRASCRILTRSLEEGPASALVAASRRRRVTLHSLFNAAIILAVNRQVYGDGLRVARGIYFSDLRPYLEPPVQEGRLGCFGALLMLDERIEPRDDVWSLAERFNRDAYSLAKSGDKFLFPFFSPRLMRTVIHRRSRRMGVTAISYTGVPFLGREDVGIEEFHAFASNNVLGPEFTSQVRLFRRRIWWDMVYLESDMNGEQAGATADEVIRILEDAGGGQGEGSRTSGGEDG